MFKWIRTDRRLFIAMIATGLALAGCERQPEKPPQPPPPPPSPPVAETAPTRLPTLPPPALGRSDVLLALDAASSAYAAGRPAQEAENLTGRRFSIRQAFGCPGSPSSGEGEGQARWKWNAKKTAIELSLRPADWTEAPIMGGGEHWEAVEGFWLVRPWLRDEGCPAVAASAEGAEDAAPPAPSPQTAGLAVVFEQGGSRVGRRDGKAFSFTIRGEPAPKPSAAGYRLVLEGRFTAFPDGRAIRCRADSPDRRPLCVVAAEVDRVAFEDADGKVLSEWRPA
jgi:hypothetical protein